MSICLIEFPISVLGEPYLYHQSVCITRKWGSIRSRTPNMRKPSHILVNFPSTPEKSRDKYDVRSTMENYMGLIRQSPVNNQTI